MTNHSNAIDDILNQFSDDVEILGGGGHYAEYRSQAEQALYEAVVACVPKKNPHNPESAAHYNEPECCLRVDGFNQYRELALTNLANLFGISKEGVDTE